MAAHLQEVLAQYVGPILVQYAQNNVGLEQAASFKAVEKSIPAVLAGVISHVGDEHAAKRFFNLLTGTNVDTQWLKPEWLQSEGLSKVESLGRQWMGLLFGSQAADVQNAVAQDAGLNTEQAGNVLAFAIPAVLASLKQYIQSNQYGQHQFYGQLMAQESFFAKIFSPKLLAAIGIPSAAALVAGVRTWGDGYFTSRPSGGVVANEAVLAEEHVARTTPPPVESEEAVVLASSTNSNGWVKWLLALVVLGLAGWLAYTYLLPQQAAPAPATPVAASAPATAMAPVAASVSSSASAVQAASVPAVSTGAASAPQAASAVVDAEAAVDRVVVDAGVLKFYFATGSAKVAPEAKDAAAEVLAAAKEGKKLIVSGYNDATGSAESNEWLSKKRAQAVRSFLRKQGVPVAQIELVKPQKTEGDSGNMAQDRRVEVTIAP